VPTFPASLARLGADDRLAALTAELPADRPLGRVVRVDRGRVVVETATGLEHLRPPEPLAVGDWVGVDGAAEAVASVVPRRSLLARRAPGRATGSLLLAANLDRVLIAQPLDRGVNPRRLERELVLAWESGALPLVVLTKADQCDDVDAAVSAAEQVALGVDVVAVSAVTGVGLDAVAAALRPGTTFVLLGASGSGKSTLLNALVGAEVQATGAVREADGRGRHTTTAAQLVVLPGGAIVIDTPGIRAVGLWDGGDGLEHVFAEIEALASGCRFRDCQHGREPGCAVREGVEPDRLESWRRLQREVARTDGQRAGWEKAEARKALRTFSRAVREGTRAKRG
jgi:ribosome biogenesis GTPase